MEFGGHAKYDEVVHKRIKRESIRKKKKNEKIPTAWVSLTNSEVCEWETNTGFLFKIQLESHGLISISPFFSFSLFPHC